MPEAIFRGIIKAGRYCPDDLVRHGAWLAKAEGRRVLMSLARERLALRSQQQNRFFHGPVISLVSALWKQDGVRYVTAEGVEMDLPDWAIKESLVSAFGGKTVDTPLGPSRPSTREMTVTEFAEMLDRIGEYCAHKDGARAALPAIEDWMATL